ncbi:iron ABC transporter substrate-binding protein [Halarcobacter ebronensis]|uniref:Iron ABC transporter substrate-binding protein n=1 Tax=Halarcobacter ebronensis TaxID=1462615 RepID=A0A4Q0YIF8_9BACT|nr:helical backbone metal receptor [Halarcobacter ebronensis]RXJ70123.1 iron ABC transporter substrate-binding protein [Halarcobacter ebronensis]
MKKALLLIFIISNIFASSRIVTLSPSLNEIVFALGCGEDIVANTLYSDYPKESKKIPKVGGYASLSLEKIVLANPSLVLVQDYDEELLEKLKKLGLTFHSFKTDNLNSIKNTIKSIGKILKKESRAEELILDINNSLESIKNIVENRKIMIVISPKLELDRSIYISGNNLYFNDIINYSGNTNAYSSKSNNQPVVNVEKIIKMNPDIVILLAPFMHSLGLKKEQLISPWENLPIRATKDNNIYVIDKDYAGIPSNRVINFIEDFKEVLEDVKSR